MVVRTDSTRIDSTLWQIIDLLKEVDGLDEYVIFGSTSLILRGILDREPGDIDMFVTERVWGRLLPHKDWHVETPNAGDPPILVNHHTPIMIHAFFDWSDPRCEMDVPALLKDPEYISYGGVLFNVITVQEALRHKEDALTKGGTALKHIPDIAIIKEYLNGSV